MGDTLPHQPKFIIQGDNHLKANNKISMLIYATDEQRDRIKKAAAKMNLSVSKFMLECVMEQVSSIEEITKRNDNND